jgi:hypothetical protein
MKDITPKLTIFQCGVRHLISFVYLSLALFETTNFISVYRMNYGSATVRQNTGNEFNNDRLSKGTYLGSTSHLFNTDGAVASITTYPDPESCENRHCHENGHLSLVMQGGSVEKEIIKI